MYIRLFVLMVTVVSYFSFTGTACSQGDPTQGSVSFSSLCASCHGSSGQGGSAPALIGCSRCNSYDNLVTKINDTMPQNNPSACTGTCSEDTAAYIFVTLNGNTLPGAYSVYIPHITAGFFDWIDYLQSDNNDSVEASFTLNLYGSGFLVYSQVYTVAGYSELTPPIDLKSVASTAETGIITYDNPNLKFRFVSVNQGGGITEFELGNTLHSKAGFYFTDFEETDLHGTIASKGAAIANMTDAAVNVTLYALGTGSILDSFSTTIGPYQRIFGIHTDWFPLVELDQMKRIIAVSSTDALTGIVIANGEGHVILLFTPASDAQDFTPTP